VNIQNDNPEIGQSVVAGGLRTNFHQAGEGPAVLLIHGSGPGVSAWANWRVTIPALARTHRVIAPDVPGFGYTERPDGVRYGLESWVAHACSFLDALGIPAADIVGNSFGGGLALALAIRHPERVRRLVLMGSAGFNFPVTEGLELGWGYTPSLHNMRRLMEVFCFDQGLVTDALVDMRYRASIRAGVQEAYATMFPAPRQRGIESLAAPVDQLRALPHEVMLIHGREDRIIPLQSSLELLSLIPPARLHVFGQCGHWTQIEKADEFNPLVAQFLRDPIPLRAQHPTRRII
jgi:2-hydroxymuconate-semialdehyde hydrolase